MAYLTQNRKQDQQIARHTAVAYIDTIAAIATPPGYGGIGIVRVSGPTVREIARNVIGALPAPRSAHYTRFLSAGGDAIDQGIALFFPAPRSFTGEDVLELHGHGGSIVMNMLLQRMITLGARIARPGEFTERAFLNGKLDLAQAEAVADLIESGSEIAVRSALRSLQGVFSDRVRGIVEQLVALRSYVEAAIDFPEEEINFLEDSTVSLRLETIERMTNTLLETAQQGRLLHDGMTVVLAGPPNAGKSSLLNALAQQDAAIVSPIPGTTRDVVREQIQLDGMPVQIVDTAGLRADGDAIESEGIRRAQAAIAHADRILLVIDDTQSGKESVPAGLLPSLPGNPTYTLVRNKIDLSGRPPGLEETESSVTIALSAKTGAGLALLRTHLKHCMGFRPAGEGMFTARARHINALRRAQEYIVAGKQQLQQTRAGELLAEELRLAQNALNEITGEFTSEDLLGKIFSSFCIGK